MHGEGWDGKSKGSPGPDFAWLAGLRVKECRLDPGMGDSCWLIFSFVRSFVWGREDLMAW